MRFEVFYFSLCQKCFALTKVFSFVNSRQNKGELALPPVSLVEVKVAVVAVAVGSAAPLPTVTPVCPSSGREAAASRWMGHLWENLEPGLPWNFPPVYLSQRLWQFLIFKAFVINFSEAAFMAENESYGDFTTFMMEKGL